MRNSIIEISITEGAVTEPVTLEQAKAQCVVDFAADDAYITALIKQCRQEFESICGISIVEKNIVLIANWEREQQLPYPPVKSINDIKSRTGYPGFANEYGTPNTYSIDGGLFYLSGCSRLRISYTTGMETVSERLKLALLNLIAWRYENRGDHEKEMSDDVRQQILQFKDFSWS